jgi:hypothetical protein
VGFLPVIPFTLRPRPIPTTVARPPRLNRPSLHRRLSVLEPQPQGGVEVRVAQRLGVLSLTL